jgi:hypothetical protein
MSLRATRDIGQPCRRGGLIFIRFHSSPDKCTLFFSTMPRPLSAAVEMRDGRPTLLLNGVPHAPLIYALTDCPGGRWSWEEVPARNIGLFAQQGVRLFQLDLWITQMLDETSGELDLTLARRQVAGVLAQCPDAAVMFRLHANPSRAWCLQNPDECVGYADTTIDEKEPWGLVREVGTDGQAPLRASFASQKWLDWAHKHLADFCSRMAETPEGGSVFGIQIAYGLYGEWHQFGFLHHDPDTGVAATRSFREWLRALYGDDAGLAEAWNRPGTRIDSVVPPDSPSRETADLGPLRDPRKRQDIIDYFTWLHGTLADAVLTLAETVKRSWTRPIVTAAFQGYFYGQFGRNAAGSHLAHDKVLASPHLDCMCSPASYTDGVRAMGGSGHGRGILGAVRRAGKLWLDENDHGTHLTGCPWDRSFHSTPDDDIACIRRNALQPVLRGGGQWWFDFGMIAGTADFASCGNIGWWDHPRLAAEIKAVREVAQSRHGRSFVRHADVLVVQDPWSFRHTVAKRWSLEGFNFGDQPPVGPNPFSGRGMDGLLEGLFHSGLVFDDAIIGELDTMDLSPYRLIFFGSSPVLDLRQRETIAARVATSDRHVVLTGYVGWGDGREIGAALATSLSGIPTSSRDADVPTSRLDVDGSTEEQILEPPKHVPVYDVPPSHVFGRWSDGTPSAAMRQGDDATWWSFAVSPVAPDVLRALGRRAGCHVINDHNDATLAGDGLIMVHTEAGGDRSIRLHSGRKVALTLAPRSTIVLDSETGDTVLG